MFFFENYTVVNVLIFLAVCFGLLLVNEVTRRSKIASLVFYIVVPIVFTIFVWGQVSNDTTQGNWFAWVKCYSALAGVIGFMLLRYVKKLQTNKYMLFFPALILFVNIIEAVVRDFEVAGLGTVYENGLTLIGGPWNVINGIAGILCGITITGWVGIKVAKTKSQDMVWADQQWFWIISYGIWNLSYVYNCIPERSFYAGVALIAVCTLAAFIKSKGLWLQHRAQTLALWAMFTLTFPAYASTQYFDIVSTNAAAPKLVLAILAIIANVAVLGYEVYTIIKTKRNPLKTELYKDLKSFDDILVSNHLK